jgi:hypothetical protein
MLHFGQGFLDNLPAGRQGSNDNEMKFKINSKYKPDGDPVKSRGGITGQANLKLEIFYEI